MAGGVAFTLVLGPAANWASKGIQSVRSEAALAKALRVEVAALRQENELLRVENTALQRIAFRDPLTNAFTEAALREGPLAKRVADLLASGKEVYALKFDVDHLKAANELVGHISGGDVILRESAEHALMVAALRESDIVIRSSSAGDEFLVIFKADAEGAQGLAARLQELRLNSPARLNVVNTMRKRRLDGSIPERVVTEAFRNGQIPANGNIGTLSIGYTKYKPGETLEEFLTRADEALHHAKKIPGKGSVFAFDVGN
jgi:diguanylate cyclase (GGDEF)-like protein